MIQGLEGIVIRGEPNSLTYIDLELAGSALVIDESEVTLPSLTFAGGSGAHPQPYKVYGGGAFCCLNFKLTAERCTFFLNLNTSGRSGGAIFHRDSLLP